MGSRELPSYSAGSSGAGTEPGEGSSGAQVGDQAGSGWPTCAALAAIVESTDDAVVGVTLDGTVRSWNPAAERLLGYTAAEAIGRPVARLCPPGDEEQVRKNLARIGRGERVPTFESTRVTKSGRTVAVSLTVSPVRGPSGAIAGASAILRDVSERKRSESELIESERRFRTLADSAPVLIWVSDAAGKGTLFNRPWLEFTGRTAEQELGDGWLECIHPDDRAAAAATCAAAIARREPFRIEWRMRRADGVYRWMLDVGVPRFGPDGTCQGYVGSCVDITERHAAAESAREAESRLRTITDAVPALISYIDRDRRYRLNNRAYEEWFGRPRGEMIGRSVEEVVGPTTWAVIGPKVEEAFSGRPLRYEAEVDFRDGGRRWIDAAYVPHLDAGCVRGVVVMVQDVTTRKRAEEALRDREERLRAIVETAADAIVTIDAVGTIDSFNPAAERIFGYATDEAVGRNVSLLMPPPHRDGHDGYLARYRETGEPRVVGTVRRLVALRKDGTRFPIELSVSEIDNTGRFTGIVRDVSEREALQEHLLTVAEAEQRRIGGDLHDDVGQELTGLGLAAEALLESLREHDLPEASIAARIVEGLRRTHEKVRRLSHGLMPVEIDSEGLMSALAELAAGIETADGVRCSFDCPRPVAVPDGRAATQLFRIAQEAVSNAIRHARPRHVRVCLTSDTGRITLRVRDDGIGLGDAPGGGSGLRIMRHRADLIGARLEVGPADGGGTEVICFVDERAGDGL